MDYTYKILSMPEFQVDTAAIILAAATVIGTSILFLVKELYLEPNRDKKSSKRKAVEERLEAYGRLSLILDAAAQKIKRQGLDKNKENTHLFETDDKTKFRNIFAEKSYLFSSKINDEFLKVIRKDEYFALNSDKGTLLINLKEMHDYVSEGYLSLKKEFEKLNDFELP